MKANKAALASLGKENADAMFAGHESAEVHLRARTGGQSRLKVGVSAADLIARLKQAKFTQAEQVELKAAMDAAGCPPTSP